MISLKLLGLFFRVIAKLIFGRRKRVSSIIAGLRIITGSAA
jgi:hypothetical protein